MKIEYLTLLFERKIIVTKETIITQQYTPNFNNIVHNIQNLTNPKNFKNIFDCREIFDEFDKERYETNEEVIKRIQDYATSENIEIVSIIPNINFDRSEHLINKECTFVDVKRHYLTNILKRYNIMFDYLVVFKKVEKEIIESNLLD